MSRQRRFVRMRAPFQRDLVRQRAAFVRKSLHVGQHHRLAPAQRFRSLAEVVRGDARDRIERVAAIIRAVARLREVDVMPSLLHGAQDASALACKGRSMVTLVRFARRTGFHALA
jgi:hypothetical protein